MRRPHLPRQPHSVLGRALAAALVVGLLGALFAPLLGWLWRSWQVHPHYAHGPLVPLAAAALLWRARDAMRGPGSDAGLVVIGGGIALHLVALRWSAQPVSALALLVVLLGLALLAGGRRALDAALLPIGLMALAVPLPTVEALAPPLAGGVARLAAASAGVLGVGVVQAGAQLTVGDGALTVGAPCSGLNSIVALSTLAVAMAGLLEGSRPRRAALVLSAVPLALTANWARLTGLLWMADTFGVERGLDVFHGPASPAAFLLATVGLLVASQQLGCHVRSR